MTHAEIASLLGRDTDPPAVGDVGVAGKRVLVTGAGGSIGSELCRLIAGRDPARLVMMERCEGALFNVDHSVRPEVPRVRALVDVTNEARVAETMERQRPDIVIHAAAHKHVPLLEESPGEAWHNNVEGTRLVALHAERCGVGKFVLISTDKAVNPSSVMGRTKREAELVVSRAGRMHVGVVRFGNVAGSSGSVLDVWERQWAATGSVQVTDPEMTRYFLTLPEAAALTLNTLPMLTARPSLFIFDMGEPASIAALAGRFLDARSGRPGACTPVYVGIRPGEKIHEQLHYAHEHMRPTAHPRIRSCPMTGPIEEAA